MTNSRHIDKATQTATRAFIQRIAGQYDLAEVIFYGSRARQTHRPDSDADLATILRGAHGNPTLRNLP